MSSAYLCRMPTPTRALLVTTFLLGACTAGPASPTPQSIDGARRLPTGAVLDPAGPTYDVGPYPFTMIAAPEHDRAVLLLSGYRDNGIQVVDTRTGAVLQTLSQPAAFVGLVFAPNGRRLYVSGGDRDQVYVYDWLNGVAKLADSIVLEVRTARQHGLRYPAGMALSLDGRRLYVAENLSDSLAVIDVATKRIVQRLAVGRYPYGVVVGADSGIYVSAWGGHEVWHRTAAGRVTQIAVARHPSTLVLSGSGSLLYVASGSTDRVSVIDTRRDAVVREIVDTVPGGAGEGSTPGALLRSPDGRHLFVAEADNNAVADFDISQAQPVLLGRIPTGWYPSGLVLHGDTLIVANAKGRGTSANGSNGPGPGAGPARKPASRGGTLGQLTGTVSIIPMTGINYATSTARVARANGWDRVRDRGSYPPFEHVIYVIKENRTYDQVFGDLAQADGDTSLVFFNRSVSPNHHALAERFGIYDRFFVNAEVSADGHNWSTGAYATDYVEKTVPLNYGSKGRTYDYEGTNRGVKPEKDADAAEPANGYLWDLAKRKNISFRNFGEFVEEAPKGWSGVRGLKPFLDSHTDSAYNGFDLAITDQSRVDTWLKALELWSQEGQMPALQIVRLPNDHTEGAKAGAFTPRAYMADNDLALGRMVEALSKSAFWKNSVVFVLEDDAQNGPDHVDSHRSPMMIISAYNQPHVWHRFGNTTDVIATIEEILSLDHLSQFDKFGRPYRGVFAAKPDLTPYAARIPETSLTERNPAGTPAARASARLDFSREDRVDDEVFNRVLWLAIKGTRPYPGGARLTAPRS